MIDTKAISVRELASYLSIGICKAYALCKQPDFPSFRCGNKILVDVDKLNDWIENRQEVTLKGV